MNIEPLLHDYLMTRMTPRLPSIVAPSNPFESLEGIQKPKPDAQGIYMVGGLPHRLLLAISAHPPKRINDGLKTGDLARVQPNRIACT